MKKINLQPNVPVVPFQLDPSTAIKITMGGSMFQERSLMIRPDLWHRIRIMRGTKYEKEYVLKSIINAVEPADLIPVKYQDHGEDTSFIARNCGPALEKLCKSSLILNNSRKEPLVLGITLGFASIQDIKVNMQALLLAALCRRFDPNKKTLCLDSFHKDTEMSKTVYCPLSQPRTFSYVLKVAKNALTNFETLNLQRNEMCNLSAIESSNFGPTLKCIDLRYNNLMGMEALTPLRCLSITELWLDGNPLCENYSSPMQYVESARRYCPHLQKLDGMSISTAGLPLTYNSYFNNEDKAELMNQFVKHFFTLYDQKDRAVLKGLYHKDAFYSVTIGISVEESTKKKLGKYFMANRNLVKLVDFAKSQELLLYGPDEILQGLQKLPPTCHNKNTFQCDLLYESDDLLVISVEGIFQQKTKKMRTFSFNRTFVLIAGEDNEYNILNDQNHVDKVHQVDQNAVDKFTNGNVTITCMSAKEKEQLTAKLKDVSTMNENWCRKYLEDVDWDIRKAIMNFMEKYRKSCVPQEAFRK